LISLKLPGETCTHTFDRVVVGAESLAGIVYGKDYDGI